MRVFCSRRAGLTSPHEAGSCMRGRCHLLRCCGRRLPTGCITEVQSVSTPGILRRIPSAVRTFEQDIYHLPPLAPTHLLCTRRPMRAQLALRCPKLSVMLRAPAGALQLPVFEASLQHVAASLSAGSRLGQQLQSGAGPLSMEVPVSFPFHASLCSSPEGQIPASGLATGAAAAERAGHCPWRCLCFLPDHSWHCFLAPEL